MKPFLRIRPGFLLVFLLAIAGCDAAGDDRNVVEGVDFDLLFAPPTTAELASVESEWAQRDVSAVDVEVERTEDVRAGGWAGVLRVVRHRVGEATHYGAIITPAREPDRPRPVLMYLHGDDAGVSIDDVLLTYELVPQLSDEFILVLPSFRSEPLVADGQTYVSTGEPSPWDRDVDDALALLNVALEVVEGADPERIATVGFSRGATVALLMAARDPRIDGVVEFFGATDFFGLFIQDIVRQALRNDLRDLPGVSDLNEQYIQPLKRREIELEALRRELARRSPLYFASRLPPVQVHHGMKDDVVPFTEAEALIEEMQRLGAAGFEYYLYPNGSHHPLTMTGSIDRTAEFLLSVTRQPPS